MTLIQQYEQLHKEKPNYGHSGSKHLPKILELFDEIEGIDMLDYGCGKGNLMRKINKSLWDKNLYDRFCDGYDPAVPEHSGIPLQEPYDMVISTDVLEHIEPENLSEVLGEIKGLAGTLIYLAIALRPDSTNLLPDGTNPHKIIETSDWWTNTLTNAFPGWTVSLIERKEGYEGIWVLRYEW